MRFPRVSLTLLAGLPALAAMLAGCQDGPIPENRVLNPWVREQWEEDEKFGPTFYKRMEELAAIRGRAASLPESERERLAQEIVDVFREEPSSAMRSELARTLAHLPGATAQSGLGAALVDEDSDVRIAACQGLARLKNEESLALLAKTVESDEQLDVRIAAVRGLGSYQTPSALSSLGVALEDANPAIQKAAIDSLAASTGRAYGNSVPAWKEYLAGGNPTKPPGPTLAERIGWPWY
jgi:HEAT repeat protein